MRSHDTCVMRSAEPHLDHLRVLARRRRVPRHRDAEHVAPHGGAGADLQRRRRGGLRLVRPAVRAVADGEEGLPHGVAESHPAVVHKIEVLHTPGQQAPYHLAAKRAAACAQCAQTLRGLYECVLASGYMCRSQDAGMCASEHDAGGEVN